MRTPFAATRNSHKSVRAGVMAAALAVAACFGAAMTMTVEPVQASAAEPQAGQ